MSVLLSQRDLVTREQQNRIDQARESGGPTVPGFGSLEALEKQHLQIQSDIERTRQDIADRQRSLERSIIEQQKALEAIQTGDDLFNKFSGMVEAGAVEFITSRLERTPEAEARMIEGMAQLSPRREFCQHWPAAKKIFEKRAKDLDKAIKTMMKEENTNV